MHNFQVMLGMSAEIRTTQSDMHTKGRQFLRGLLFFLYSLISIISEFHVPSVFNKSNI